MRYEDFQQQLQIALTHLYDPDYQPPQVISLGTGRDFRGAPGGTQVVIIRAIGELEPGSDVPVDSRLWRDFSVLHHRFVLRLSQEETAERMGMSVRSVQRAQREAVHVLARRLWARNVTEEARSTTRSMEWESQLQEELVSLQRSMGQCDTTLREVISGAMRLARLSVASEDVRLELPVDVPDVHLRIHPTVLRQIFLEGIQKLHEAVPLSTVLISTEQHGDHLRITLSVGPTRVPRPVDMSLAQGLLAQHRATVEVSACEERIVVEIDLPIMSPPNEKVKVLVVDDNADVVTLFDAYCAGSRYEILSMKEGKDILERIKHHLPDVILLDVMLPDVDGWDVLLALAQDPATQSIPIVVCSVVMNKQLALTLGAALCLPKPVYRDQLIDALDQVSNRAAIDA